MSIIGTAIAKKIIGGFFGSGLGTITSSIVEGKKARLAAEVAKLETATEQDRVRIQGEIRMLELDLIDIDKGRSFTKGLLESWWFLVPTAAIVIVTAIWYCSIILRTQYGYADPTPTPLDAEVKDIAKWIIWIMLGGGSVGAVALSLRKP